MLMKLYKQEVIEIVVAYERYRFALSAEMDRRNGQRSDARVRSSSGETVIVSLAQQSIDVGFAEPEAEPPILNERF